MLGPQPHPIPALPILAYLRLHAFTDSHWSLALPRGGSAAFLTSDWKVDLSRARKDLAYTPAVGVRDAVRRTLDWYREQGLV